MKRGDILLEQGHQRLIKARHGYVLYNKNDVVIGRLVETYGEYFEAEVEVFRRFLAPGDIALDIGANIGTHTLAMAQIVGPQGFVFAFEPQRLVFQALCANVALNGLKNVHCVGAAVGEQPGRLALGDIDPDSVANFGSVDLASLDVSGDGLVVERLVLDDFLPEVARLNLMKIDVEGMEELVLRGARRTLERLAPVLYVENDRVSRSASLLSLLHDLDYTCYWHLPVYAGSANYFSEPRRLFPVALIDRGGDEFESIGFAVNLLCVPAARKLAVRGLRPATDCREHPLRRECVGLFVTSDGSAIPVKESLT